MNKRKQKDELRRKGMSFVQQKTSEFSRKSGLVGKL